MKQIVIENPIINSPFLEPKRHFRFDDDGITNDIIETRRISQSFVPIAKPKKRGKQLDLDLGVLSQDRVERNKFINDIRERVSLWRQGGYRSAVNITPITRRLLEYWQNPERERRLFFCQIEALETLIYITEIAKKSGDAWIINQLNQYKDAANPKLFRMGTKMATGSGKTVVMSMVIAWHTLNKVANPRRREFSSAFLIVSPGITIRDRLGVLQPNNPENYYQKLDLVPPDLRGDLGKAKIVITNYHAFKLREKTNAASLTKKILNYKKNHSAFTETPSQMVRRVCRDFDTKKNIIVINDEAHHCYRRRENGDEPKYKGEDKKEAQNNQKQAQLWISGIEAIEKKLGVKTVYDLSATPFYLKGSGYTEGTLFPWVVSDFSLIDAIESGIVKIPRVPVSDDSMKGELPTYRNIWALIRDHLPKKGRKSKETEPSTPEPKLPKELEGALLTLYSNYEKSYQQWSENTEAIAKGLTPPVFIVVCNNTSVSKMVFDWIAGWDTQKTHTNGKSVLAPGKLPQFSNVQEGLWTPRPNTILVDSQQLESGESLTSEFKKLAAQEIEEFKAEYRHRSQGGDPHKISDEDLLREVLNTVGKVGKLGENIRCVVSVSMLTEGWDANSVTHILGIRAFGTQLLCEQVVGRGLRRISYTPTTNQIKINGKTLEIESFAPEYAEVYGVPFAFIPCAGSSKTPKTGALPTRVRALEERRGCEITFPRVIGYRYEIGSQKLTPDLENPGCAYVLSTEDVPTKTLNAPIIGQSSVHTLDELKFRREQEVAFLLGKLTLEKYFRYDGIPKKSQEVPLLNDADVQAWLFPQILKIAKLWLAKCVTYKSGTYPQLLLLNEHAHDASDCIYQAICAGEPDKFVKPILRPHDPIGSTRYVDFSTARPVYTTDPNKNHISHVVADTNSWEQKMAQILEDMDEVDCYVKNQGLGFLIPYILKGQQKNYQPDFIVRINDGHKDPLNLIVEVSGEARKDKQIKVSTAFNLWLPAINQHGRFGRWNFIEITDPWNGKNTIKAFLASGTKKSQELLAIS